MAVAPEEDVQVKTVGIVGSGIMGSGIAQVAAAAGYEVALRSRRLESARQCIASVEKGLGRLVERGKLDAHDRDATLARIRPVETLGALGECDLVIESVVEDLGTKQELFRRLDEAAHPGAILASNTSTLSIGDIAVATRRPEQVVGIHFFNPAPLMSLVEVVPGLVTSPSTVEAALEFATACGKDAVLVKDRAGFVVNALLFPYLNNAVRMLESGIANRDDIDKAMRGGCNFPMGPLALLDLVGLDTSVAILDALHREFGDPAYAPHPLLRRMVAAGMLGKKSGAGFYTY